MRLQKISLHVVCLCLLFFLPLVGMAASRDFVVVIDAGHGGKDPGAVAADLSSDRAGLLACQNYSAAARAILWDMGMPPEELMSLSDEEMLFLSEDYDQELKNLRQDIVEETASTWDKWIGTASPGFVRLRELYTWYRDGYRQLLDRFVTSM